MELIRLEGVSKTYADEAGPVLKNIDLVVEGGGYLSVEGVSGSGKSTLLYILGGLLTPTTGRVLYKGKDVYSLKDRELSLWRGRHVGYLFQDIQMAQALTVRENMVLARRFGNDKGADIEGLIQSLGLEEVADKLPGHLSGGQKRRAMTGCVLVRRPQIMLADEPTNDLDREWACRVMDLLQEQIHPERSLILVTHDPRWAASASVKYSISDGVLIHKE